MAANHSGDKLGKRSESSKVPLEQMDGSDHSNLAPCLDADFARTEERQAIFDVPQKAEQPQNAREVARCINIETATELHASLPFHSSFAANS